LGYTCDMTDAQFNRSLVIHPRSPMAQDTEFVRTTSLKQTGLRQRRASQKHHMRRKTPQGPTCGVLARCRSTTCTYSF